MAARLRRRQFLYLGMASLGTALAGGAVVRSMQGASHRSRPAAAPRLSSTAGALELDWWPRQGPEASLVARPRC